MEDTTTVRMTRDAAEFPDSHHANVPADAVADFKANGWRIENTLDHDGNGKKGGAKKAKASTDPLDVPQPDAGGLTLRELHADCEGRGIEFDPAATAAELFNLLNIPE